MCLSLDPNSPTAPKPKKPVPVDSGQAAIGQADTVKTQIGDSGAQRARPRSLLSAALAAMDAGAERTA